jgi:hypothetical protein
MALVDRVQVRARGRQMPALVELAASSMLK